MVFTPLGFTVASPREHKGAESEQHWWACESERRMSPSSAMVASPFVLPVATGPRNRGEPRTAQGDRGATSKTLQRAGQRAGWRRAAERVASSLTSGRGVESLRPCQR